MTILWALHVQGPDDVYAAPSWAAAAEAATWLEHRALQARLRSEPDFPAVSFAAIPWPHSAASHAADLPRWSEVYPGLPASTPETRPAPDPQLEPIHVIASDPTTPIIGYRDKNPPSMETPAAPKCDCEGPQKVGADWHAPYCSTVPGGKELRERLERDSLNR